MAFQIKTLRDQHWLLIFQDPKSVRENPHQSHQKQITDTGKKSFYNQPAAPSREWSCKKPLQVFDVDRDAPDSWVPLMLWGGISREADRSYSPEQPPRPSYTLWINQALSPRMRKLQRMPRQPSYCKPFLQSQCSSLPSYRWLLLTSLGSRV